MRKTARASRGDGGQKKRVSVKASAPKAPKPPMLGGGGPGALPPAMPGLMDPGPGLPMGPGPAAVPRNTGPRRRNAGPAY